ncbi:MAG: pyrroloquinoline quinone-dependent dehydrogenase [Terriglobia bacterium]
MNRLGSFSSLSLLRGRLAVTFAIAALISLSGIATAQEWPNYGGDLGGTKYSALAQINRQNVKGLKVAWTYHTGDVSDGTTYNYKSTFECTPLVVDGVMYITTPFSRVIALDPESGKALWTFDPDLDKDRPINLFISRGPAFWQKGKEKRVIIGTLDGRLIALNALDGKPIQSFGENGTVDLARDTGAAYPGKMNGMTSPPLIYHDLIITGSVTADGEPRGPSGDVRAFDVYTGKTVWRFHVVPHAGEVGNETWEKDAWQDRAGVNAWSTLSCDKERGLLFLPLTSPAHDPYGGDRKGKDLFGNSLAAVDANTGKLVWYYQIVHHDLWDYDLPAQPVLVTVRRNGKLVPGVAQVTKMGMMFLFNRVTGEPLFPIEERKVPASEIAGEETWPTQPFPLKPPPYARQSMSLDEITNVTPESRSECLQIMGDALPKDIYTPWDSKLIYSFPGDNGGTNWGGASYDPSSNVLFVNSMDIAVFGSLEKTPEGSSFPYRYRIGKALWFWDSNWYPCQKPPWGQLTAIDLNTGKFRWQVPLGVEDALVARGLPPTGAPNIGGSMVTAGGLVFIGATNDGRFRAFDRDTGKELWVTKLPASGFANPMTFQGPKSGKQYVVIAAGGGNKYDKHFSDALVAYTLP